MALVRKTVPQLKWNWGWPLNTPVLAFLKERLPVLTYTNLHATGKSWPVTCCDPEASRVVSLRPALGKLEAPTHVVGRVLAVALPCKPQKTSYNERECPSPPCLELFYL